MHIPLNLITILNNGHMDTTAYFLPLPTGQRMSEYDMFASPHDPDRSFRPTLEHAQSNWQRKQQQPNHRFINQQQQNSRMANQPHPPTQSQLRPVNHQQQQFPHGNSQQLQGPRVPSGRQNSRTSAIKGPLARK